MSSISIGSGAAPRNRRRLELISGIGVIGNIAAFGVIFFVIIAVIGPWIAPSDPDTVSFSNSFGAASFSNPFGFDESGRDLLSRMLDGARSSLLGPLIVAVLSAVLGTAIAITAAWFGGWVDSIISLVLDVLFSIPGLLLAVLAVAIFGRGLTAPAIALVIANIPYFARIVRSVSVGEAASPYIASLRVQGFSTWSICWRHLFPNVRPTVIAQAMITFSFATVDLAALSYLGLGVQPPSANWGLMVSEGQQGVLQGQPAEALVGGVCLVLAVLAINVLGTRLMDRAEERGS